MTIPEQIAPLTPAELDELREKSTYTSHLLLEESNRLIATIAALTAERDMHELAAVTFHDKLVNSQNMCEEEKDRAECAEAKCAEAKCAELAAQVAVLVGHLHAACVAIEDRVEAPITESFFDILGPAREAIADIPAAARAHTDHVRKLEAELERIRGAVTLSKLIALIMSFVRQEPVPMERRPTIAELETMLNAGEEDIVLAPDGGIMTKPKPLTVGQLAQSIISLVFPREGT